MTENQTVISTPIVEKAHKHIERLLTEELPERMVYHNFEHTMKVTESALLLGNAKQLSEEELEVLALASLFHDTGFTKTYQGHEEASKAIAREFLQGQQFPPEKINRVLHCIDATKLTYQPNGTLESIMKDADLSSLGRKGFMEHMKRLRTEWEAFLEIRFSDATWYAKEMEFMESHEFYTDEAKELFNKRKQKNIKMLKKLIKKEATKSSESILAGNRQAQMMFKTALRNHIDLTNIADNKANMMLSINAVIITLTMPLLATQLQENKFLIIPTSILLLTCVLSVIFATLVTRPIKMTGMTNLEKLKQGTTNLFFFGNFYSMKLGQYQEAIKSVISDEQVLDNTIINDLFFLGASLGNKYAQLRICYMVFMVGVTLAVLTFAVTFFFTVGN